MAFGVCESTRKESARVESEFELIAVNRASRFDCETVGSWSSSSCRTAGLGVEVDGLGIWFGIRAGWSVSMMYDWKESNTTRITNLFRGS
jgi:hypothetical protein